MLQTVSQIYIFHFAGKMAARKFMKKPARTPQGTKPDSIILSLRQQWESGGGQLMKMVDYQGRHRTTSVVQQNLRTYVVSIILRSLMQ